MKIFRRFVVAFAALLFVMQALTAHAAPVVLPYQGGWQAFDWINQTGLIDFPPDGFVLNTTQATFLEIADIGIPGDSFNVIVSGSINAIFSTPDVPILSSLQMLNPDLAFGNPSFSWGQFTLGPGSYTINISLRTGSPGGGSGFVRAAAVPEPATILLLSTGLAGIVAVQRRRRRIDVSS